MTNTDRGKRYAGQPIDPPTEQEEAFLSIKDAIEKQGHDILNAGYLINQALRLFKDIAQASERFKVKLENNARRVVLYESEQVVVQVYKTTSNISAVSVSDGTKCQDFHGSSFTNDTLQGMFGKIEDFIVRYCAHHEIIELK
jgi:hypothetical protein